MHFPALNRIEKNSIFHRFITGSLPVRRQFVDSSFLRLLLGSFSVRSEFSCISKVNCHSKSSSEKSKSKSKSKSKAFLYLPIIHCSLTVHFSRASSCQNIGCQPFLCWGNTCFAHPVLNTKNLRKTIAVFPRESRTTPFLCVVGVPIPKQAIAAKIRKLSGTQTH